MAELETLPRKDQTSERLLKRLYRAYVRWKKENGKTMKLGNIARREKKEATAAVSVTQPVIAGGRQFGG